MNYPPEVQEFLQKYDRILLNERGIIKLFPAELYHSLDNTDLRVWCVCRAIYQLPTIELVEWLKDNFNLNKAIEIGAGNNYLYHHLGIKGIDNYSEQIPAVKLVHDILHEPSTNPPPEVEKIEAISRSEALRDRASLNYYDEVLELANSINSCNFSAPIYSIISDKSSSLITLLERIPPRQ